MAVDTLDLVKEDQNTNTQDTVNSIETEETTSVENKEETQVDTDTDVDTEVELSEEEFNKRIEEMDDEEFLQFINEGTLTPKQDTSKPKKNTISVPDTKEKTTSTESKVSEKVVKEPSVDTEQPTEPIDFEETYKTIFKPFKANGKEITPKTVDDVISLMQMGANYTKKMQTLAPVKKTYETLSKAGIKEDDLNFLIDVHNGNTEAIKTLLQKHKVDPLEIDLDTTNYVPKDNLATDEDVEFSDVLEDVKESLPRIQEILNNVWDPKSKSIILKNAKHLRELHEEIAYGRFDKIQQEVELQKTFGRYKNVPDLYAYIDILSKQNTNTSTTQQPVPNTPPLPSTTNEVSVKTPTQTKQSNKFKASPTVHSNSNKKGTLTAEELFSMPEEEFLKLSINDLV